MGIEERDIIEQFAASNETAVVSLEMVDGLKQVGQILPDCLRLGDLSIQPETQYLTRRKKEDLRRKWHLEQMEATGGNYYIPQRELMRRYAQWEDEHTDETLKAWRKQVAELTKRQKEIFSSSVGAFAHELSNVRRTWSGAITLGDLRGMTRAELETLPRIGPLKAALLKEIFGDQQVQS